MLYPRGLKPEAHAAGQKLHICAEDTACLSTSPEGSWRGEGIWHPQLSQGRQDLQGPAAGKTPPASFDLSPATHLVVWERLRGMTMNYSCNLKGTPRACTPGLFKLLSLVCLLPPLGKTCAALNDHKALAFTTAPLPFS